MLAAAIECFLVFGIFTNLAIIKDDLAFTNLKE